MTDGGGDGDATDPDRDPEPSEELLVSAGVLTETADGTDLELTDGFERDWTDRVRKMRGGDRALRWLAASRGLDPEELTVTDREGYFSVAHDGEPIEEWHSEATFLASIVAEPTLTEWLPPGTEDQLDDERRRQLATQLLAFLERCPACDGELSFEGDIDGESGTVSLHCLSCDSTILEGTTQ
jgi:hypothetical protein